MEQQEENIAHDNKVKIAAENDEDEEAGNNGMLWLTSGRSCMCIQSSWRLLILGFLHRHKRVNLSCHIIIATLSTAGPAVPVCEVCKEQPSKYKCPGCQCRTCSLTCVRQHKESAGCSGKRNRLAFVPLKEFNDKHLLSGRFLQPFDT